jgi:hypothetical protein
LALLLITCSSKSPEPCCVQYDAYTDEATYCGNHRDAVMMWVQYPDEIPERRARLDAFKDFYDGIKDCKSVACIEEGITQAQSIPDFEDEYADEHDHSEQSTDLPEDQKDDLILCGFRHAIQALEENLTREE